MYVLPCYLVPIKQQETRRRRKKYIYLLPPRTDYLTYLIQTKDRGMYILKKKSSLVEVGR